MTYDINGPWATITGHNAPLEDTLDSTKLTVKKSLESWQSNGCGKDKLVVGMATYGKSFRLASVSSNGIGANAVGPGNAGPSTSEAGTLAYFEICKDQGFKSEWIDSQKVPYAYKGDQWVGYDDAKSIQLKVMLSIKFIFNLILEN
jgi:GH18 family chitinase